MTIADAPADPFRVLEDDSDPGTVAWTAGQEAAFDRAAASWPARDRFAGRVRALATPTVRLSAPRPAGDRLFLTSQAPGADHPVVVVIEPDGQRRVLLDPGALDPSGATTVEAWHPSADGRLLAYQLASGGTENATLRVLDVGTGRVVDGPIDRIRNTSVAWLPDGSAFYYVRRLHPALNPGEGEYHRRVHLHRLGTSPDDDVMIFGDGRPRTQHYTVRVAPDGSVLVITASAGAAPRKDVWVADIGRSGPASPELVPVQVGIDARSTVLPRYRSCCHVLTDLGADHRRLARFDPANPGPDGWVDLVGEDPAAVLDDVVVLDHPDLPAALLLVARTRHAVSELAVHDLADGRLVAELPLPPCSSIGPLRALATGAAEAWFSVNTYSQPPRVYRFDAVTGAVAPWPAAPIHTAPADSDPARSAVEARQVTYRSSDGTPVRMFVMSPGPGGPDRPRPTILTVYGGFGVSMTPTYSPEIVAWVEAGGVYAVAGIRGGAEEGADWHRAGTLDRKQNTIDDLHGAAAALTAAGWTTPAQLGIWGASNGGMVVGAALTQHPELYGAVVSVAPLLDMARYQLSGMGPSWTGEYGDAGDPRQLAWLLSYSPYHHVRPGCAYPPVLFMVFDGDSRVDPWHARKMCAALQEAGTGDRPVLYRLERGVGHGLRSTSSTVALLADLLAFFAHELGHPLA